MVPDRREFYFPASLSTTRYFMKFGDKDIAEKIAKENGLTIAKLGLRFDKVVIRLLSDIRIAISNDIPKGTAILLTITAPIRLPSKTESELCSQIRLFEF